MARAINGPMPIEIGYYIMPAVVVSTGQIGEVWIAGCMTIDDGELEEQEKY